MSFVSGDLVRLSVTFSLTGVIVDPSGIQLKYKSPTGGITTLAYNTDAGLVRDSTGNYHCDITANLTGTWYFRYWGTGGIAVADEGYFVVESSQF